MKNENVKHIISCPTCQTKLYVTREDVAYKCPKCEKLFQVRKVKKADDKAKQTTKKKNKFAQFGVVNWVILAVLLLYCIALFAFLIFGLFSSVNAREIYKQGIYFPFNKDWKWAFSNYVEVFKAFTIEERLSNHTTITANFFTMSLNSIVFAGIAAGAKCTAIFLVAYATSRFSYGFSKVVYTFVIVAMVVPIVGSGPSQIVILKSLGLYEKMTSVALVAFNFLGMYFLVVYAVLQSLSKDYSEAACLDGAGEWTIMTKIMLPLVQPTIATIFLITFIENWNSYGYILVYLRSYPTLSYGVFRISTEKGGGMEHATMKLAASFLVAIPVLSLFIIFRKKLMGNVTMGGVKE